MKQKLLFSDFFFSTCFRLLFSDTVSLHLFENKIRKMFVYIESAKSAWSGWFDCWHTMVCLD